MQLPDAWHHTLAFAPKPNVTRFQAFCAIKSQDHDTAAAWTFGIRASFLTVIVFIQRNSRWHRTEGSLPGVRVSPTQRRCVTYQIRDIGRTANPAIPSREPETMSTAVTLTRCPWPLLEVLLADWLCGRTAACGGAIAPGETLAFGGNVSGGLKTLGAALDRTTACAFYTQ